ncbi:DUF4055 domain-containing protein [Candidatus Pacearchaeota archaeon]|nr:DUF4055 domain-containing protein [Candidatus Pacearchaeota archaeon]
MPTPIKNMLNLFTDIEVGTTIPLNLTTHHPLYDKNLPIWEKCRDALGGDEDIKAGSTKYLFKLNGQTNTEYTNYLNRAQWFGATGRTLDSYLGMIFRKSPQIFFRNDLSEEEQIPNTFFDSVSVDGKSLTDFIHDVTEEIISVNRCGVLVEFPQDEQALTARSEYEYETILKEKDVHPILAKYPAESIINWGWQYIGRRVVPTYFVLKETVYDGYEYGSMVPLQNDIYRVLFLEPYEDGFRYAQITLETIMTGTQAYNLRVTDVVHPMKEGKYIPYIPFFVLDDRGINYRTIEKPMINDLVNTNIGHFRNSADHENEIHIVGCKTMYFAGWDRKIYGNPKIGGALAGPAGSEPKMIEASSDSGITDEMKVKVEQMAVLGAERIAPGTNYVSSVGTAEVSNTSESSSLVLLANTLGRSFSIIADFMLSWARHPDTGVNVQINHDFINSGIRPDELLAFAKMWQQGAISRETYFENLRKKEVYPDKWTMEDEMNAIKESQQELLNFNNETIDDLIERFDSLEADVSATITSSNSGAALVSVSTAAGGSNISTSTDISDASVESATARNNEVRGSSSASAKEDSEKSPEEEKKKKEDRETHDPDQ